MASTYKTPDVYIEEIPVFPPAVAEVGTAIPAFIGYTEICTRTKTDDLLLKPTKIYSLKDYEAMFGQPEDDTIAVNVDVNNKVDVTKPTLNYLLYYAVKMYFDNGGGEAYIVSVAKYKSGTPFVVESELAAGLAKVAFEDEPTLLVIPEAVNLSATDYPTLVQAMLKQCGDLMDRFAILDIREGGAELTSGTGGSLETNRAHFGTNNLKYGAAYYPFLETSIHFYVNSDESNVSVTLSGGGGAVQLNTLKTSNTTVYNLVKAELLNYNVTMPPSGAVAGAYAAVDAARGVWKAPANVSLTDVVEPTVKVTNLQQDDLNVDPNGGLSINVLRAFAGKGTLIWGARTLAGNDNEWRYVSVRRFFNMVEESIKKSTYWAVFEPNEANTWVKVRGMIENYLIDKWRDGALAGASPKDAFFVKCGLGTTMNAQDILAGRLNVEVGLAVVRPAEFIVIKFSHKLQVS